MSEYWVSRKKYFCQYCDIYIADDAPSRQQHENGMRHKGNKDRFVRSLYKAGEKRKRDEDEEKREMAAINRAADASFAEDVAAGRAKASSLAAASSSKAESSSRKTAVKSNNPWANYSTPESLGYTDPEAVKHAAEMARRQKEGVVGEWEIITPAVAPTLETSTGQDVERVKGQDMHRDAVPERNEPADEDDTRTFKLRKKIGGLGGLYDPGLITITKKESDGDVVKAGSVAVKSEAGGWQEVSGDGDVKTEEEPVVKLENNAEGSASGSSSSLFRKRRRKI